MHDRPSRSLAIAAIALLALIATACGGVAQPQGWSAPLVTDDQLLYFPKKDVLASAPLQDGLPGPIQWTFPNDSLPGEQDVDISAVYGDLLEVDGILYFAGWEGEVYAVSAETGRLVWTTRDRIALDGSIVAGLAASADRIFLATTEGRVYALTLDNGTIAPGWNADGIRLPKGIWATPVVQGDVLYIATMNGELHAFQTADAAPAWPQPYKATTGAIPELALLDNSVLFVPTVGKAVYFVDAETGAERYPSIATDDWVWTRPAVDGNIVYFGDFSGAIRAIDITSGVELWQASGDAKIKAAPVIIGDILVVADRSPAVSFFNKTTGEQLGNRVPLSDAGTIRANVVAHDGAAYILTTKGKLFRAEPERLAVVEVPIAGVP